LCRKLGIAAWPLDVESVAERVGPRRIRARPLAARALVGDRPPILEARALRFRYEDRSRDALAGVDFSLRDGEFVALIGANGSGKSTLARLVAGILHGGSGSISWRGRSLGALGAAERATVVGYVFQNPDEQIFAATVEEEI